MRGRSACLRRPTPPVIRAVLSQSSILNPQPSTLNPQPSTLNPQPSALNTQGRSTVPDCERSSGTRKLSVPELVQLPQLKSRAGCTFICSFISEQNQYHVFAKLALMCGMLEFFGRERCREVGAFACVAPNRLRCARHFLKPP